MACDPLLPHTFCKTSLKAHVIPLDAISIRAVTRLGLVDTSTVIDKMNATLKRLVPKNQGAILSSLIRQLALDVCVADTPAIRKCALADVCPTAIEMETEKKSPSAKTKKGHSQKEAQTQGHTQKQMI